MADGYDCTCAAHSENECCCGADWTPKGTYDLRDQLAASKQREAELSAHVERLRAEASWVRDVLAAHGYSGPLTPGCCPLEDWLADDTRAMKEPEQ